MDLVTPEPVCQLIPLDFATQAGNDYVSLELFIEFLLLRCCVAAGDLWVVLRAPVCWLDAGAQTKRERSNGHLAPNSAEDNRLYGNCLRLCQPRTGASGRVHLQVRQQSTSYSSDERSRGRSRRADQDRHRGQVRAQGLPE